MNKKVLKLITAFFLLSPLTTLGDSTDPLIVPNPTAKILQAYVYYSDPACTSPEAGGDLKLWTVDSGQMAYAYINPGGCPPNTVMTNIAVDPYGYGFYDGGVYLKFRYWGTNVTIRCCPIHYRWVNPPLSPT